MGRKKQRDRIAKTVHLKAENMQFIEDFAKKEDRSFSHMADLLISRMRHQTQGADHEKT